MNIFFARMLESEIETNRKPVLIYFLTTFHGLTIYSLMKINNVK